MANIEMPDVTVEQIFQTANPTLLPPDLPTCIVGLCRQVEYRQTAGEYDPAYGVTLSYPNLKLGAVVSLSSVQVHLSNSDGIFLLDSNNYTATDDSITVNSGIDLDVRVIENSQTGETSGVFFTDTSVNFNSAFKALANTSSIIISSPSDNQKTFDVVSIVSGTKIIIKDRENGDVQPSVTLIGSTAVDGTTFVANEIIVDKTRGTLGYEISTTSFVATYLTTDSKIDGETIINQATGVVAGDYIAVYSVANAEKFIKKIIKADSTGITLDSALGTAIVSGDKYKIFHPIQVKGAGVSGDYMVGVQSGVSYYGEVYSLDNMNTITLATALKNTSNSNASSPWTSSFAVSIFRGARRVSTSNVYDGYVTKTSYSADVLVTYKADRSDLNDDAQAITGLDDAEAILGPAVPENPLGLAASVHIQASNELFYVIGAAETKAGHLAALEVLEAKDVYSLVPLSQDLEILALYKPHVENMSLPKEKMERTAIISRDIYIASDIDIGTTSKMVGGTDSTGQKFVLGLVNAGAFTTTDASTTSLSIPGIGYGARVDDMLVAFQGTTDQALTLSFSKLTSVSPAQDYIAFTPALASTATFAYQIVSNTYTDNIDDEVADNTGNLSSISAGDVINSLDSNGLVSKTLVVTSVNVSTTGISGSAYYQRANLESDDFGADVKNKVFTATTAPLSKQEQAQYIRDYAASIQSRRMVHVWAPRIKMSYSPVEDPSTQTTAILPGYYMAVGVAGMTASNPPSQPFTNLNMGVAAQLYYTNTYFKPTYLDSIASGGNYILVQSTPDSLPYARQQLTTDMTSLETREYSIPKALDWFAKFMRLNLRPYIGRYNITTNYLAQVKGVAKATIAQTVDVRKYLASVDIISLVQNPLSPDEVYLDCDALPLYPANKIRVRIYI